VQEVDEISNAVNKAHSFFARLNEKDALLGLKELSKAVDLVRAAFALCKAPEEHIEKLAKAIAMIRHPISFAYTIYEHIIVDGVEIKNEWAVATDDWEAQRYEDFGYQLGLIYSHILVGGVQPAAVASVGEFTYPDAVNFVQGFANTFYEAMHYDMDPGCVYANVEKQDISDRMEKAVLLFRLQTEVDAWRGLHEIATLMVPTLRTVFERCGVRQRDLHLLSNAQRLVGNNREFVYTARDDIIVHGVDITRDVQALAYKWYRADFLTSGRALGDLSAAVLRGSDKKKEEAAADIGGEPTLLLA